MTKRKYRPVYEGLDQGYPAIQKPGTGMADNYDLKDVTNTPLVRNSGPSGRFRFLRNNRYLQGMMTSTSDAKVRPYQGNPFAKSYTNDHNCRIYQTQTGPSKSQEGRKFRHQNRSNHFSPWGTQNIKKL